MNALETNVYPITNLGQLSAGYRLYRIRGLRAEQSEYFQNQQALVRRMSYRLKSPVTIVTRDDEPHLAIRDDAPEPPSPVSLVRATAYLDRVPGEFRLDFTKRSPETDPICLRFLQFILQEPLRRDSRLWQPSSGRPFFLKEPIIRQNGVCQYRGFAIRSALTPDGGLGLCVDVKHDRVPRNVGRQGTEILKAAKAHCTKAGYAVVMIHHTDDRRRRGEDQLAALVMRELRDQCDIPSAIIHSATGHDSFRLENVANGESAYRVRREGRSRFDGYLRNVALNKVLLTNERWPFVLSTPLHADLIIGVDVKHNTAGFTVIGKHGSAVRTLCRKSRQREMLLAEQVTTYLMELLREETQDGDVRHIVLQRDGRLWPSERIGAHRAIERLKAEGMLPPDASLTILEISKSSPVSLRLFDVSHGDRRGPWIENPEVGTCHFASPLDAYLCATGRAFRRPGTVNPLHVRYVEGSLSFEKCLEDVYALTVLAWTRPEDCTRDPITIKLNDRRLGEDAGEYDGDALSFVAGHEEEEVA